MEKKFKLLLNEFEFLKKQEDDTKDLLLDFQTEFTNDIHHFMSDNGLEKKSPINKKPTKQKETELKPSDAPTKYKKLFRKIVSNTHPDKLEKNIEEKDKEVFKEVYEETVEGYQNENYAPLLLNAMKLGMDLGDEFNEEIEMVNSIIEEKKLSIENMKKTYAWIYCNDIKEKEKNMFVKNYYEKYKKNI